MCKEISITLQKKERERNNQPKTYYTIKERKKDFFVLGKIKERKKERKSRAFQSREIKAEQKKQIKE